jgi:hypothetical protein
MRIDDTQRAIDFVHREGRVLERRILEAAVHGRPPEPVAHALRGYQNLDGGFGHGLEPDKRAPDSQPLDVAMAWQSLDWVGIAPAELVEPACEYLASVGSGVSCVTRSVREHPHAPHWSDASYQPSLNPTASLAGYLWKWSIDHPWRAAATDFCWSALSDGLPDDAHSAICVLRFLEHVPDRERAAAAIDALLPKLPTLTWLQYYAGADGYGVSPLQLVPDPRSPWRGLFPADVLEDHLEFLEKTQADDGGWELSWPTIGPAATSEWRGRRTLENLLVLRAYGRWPSGSRA